MTNGQTAVPTALQMTDDELAAEHVRGRMVAIVSVIAVTLYTGTFLTSIFSLKDAEGAGDVRIFSAAHDFTLMFVTSGFFFSVGVLLSGGVLSHLILAARSRSTLVPKLLIYLIFAGPALYAIVYPIYTLALVAAASKFADAPVQDAATAANLVQSGTLDIVRSVEEFVRLLVAIAWVMTGVYAMRIGLLTRLVGLVAVAVGAIFLFSPTFSAFIQIFWIGAVAIQLIGDSPQTPPAWKLGRPVSWREVAETAAAEADKEQLGEFEKSDQ